MATAGFPRTELVRGLGLWGAIAINVANMIGTGVFLKTRVMTCNVGSPLLVIAVWAAAGLLTLAGTFAYAEVAAMIPEAGGDYVFLRRAYGRLTGFLYGWTTFAIYKSGSQAALAVGFAIAIYNVPIVFAAVLMAAVSVSMSLIGLELGSRLGERVEEWSEEIGGGVLIVVGFALGTGLLG